MYLLGEKIALTDRDGVPVGSRTLVVSLNDDTVRAVTEAQLVTLRRDGALTEGDLPRDPGSPVPAPSTNMGGP